MREFTDDECRSIIDEGSVPESIRNSGERVAAIFTQSWCGDWIVMKRYLNKVEEPSLEVFFVEYDRKPFFEEMKNFKERVYRSGTIPYVRYFRDGELVNESNLVWRRKSFVKRFDTMRSRVSYR